MAVPRALAVGDMEILGLLPGASNATLLTRCVADDDEVLAVYKPRRGEAPLWDFPAGTLHRREVAAYVAARTLGWPNVPPTVLRGGPAGPGSAQLFVDADPSAHYFTLEADGRHGETFRRVALFDLVVNNADRKAGHCLLDAAGTIWVIDHGVCFSDEPKLRTVIWAFVGEPFPPETIDDLRRFRHELDVGGAAERALGALLSPEEVAATRRRVDAVLRLGVFPEPGPGRPFPWPPI
ncbi:MAG TPA: SCO1664 family protein [Actinomycetota bacterium]|nr:SCO1664 family protein [Actinomycetota bacterium]